jgi:hypothetical protein
MSAIPAGGRTPGDRDATRLQAIQELFWDLITAPQGVGPALEQADRGGRPRRDAFERTFAGDAGLPASERLDIYANMYFFRLHDCLREDFPRTAAWLGGDRFHNLATDFLLAHPSSHPSLRFLGVPLPAFIAGHPLAGEYPGLADMARLEWNRADIFDAADAPALTRERLATLPQEKVGDGRLRLIPAFRLLRMEYDIAPLWRRLEKDAGGETAGSQGSGNAAPDVGDAADEAGHGHRCEPGAPGDAARRKPTAVRIWRNGFIVYHKRMDDDEALCLEGALAGEPLARLCQRLAAGRSVARATARVGRILQGWLDDGILTSIDISE